MTPQSLANLELFHKELSDTLLKQKEKFEEILKETMTSIWDECPDVKEICWTQYAPYFNDGDPCYFSVKDFDYYTEDEEFESYDLDEKSFKELCPNSSEEGRLLLLGIEKNLTSPHFSNLMENFFGEDSKVIATRQGFEIQEYPHD